MSGGGGGAFIILANAKATFQDPGVQSITPHRFMKLITPIIAKEYENWSDTDKCVIFGVLSFLGITKHLGTDDSN